MNDLNHLMVRLFAATELTVCAESASLGLGWRAVVNAGKEITSSNSEFRGRFA